MYLTPFFPKAKENVPAPFFPDPFFPEISEPDPVLDPHLIKVFDPSIKDETDRFAYRFVKPSQFPVPTSFATKKGDGGN